MLATSGGSITVAGNVSGVNAAMTLYIPAGVTVNWEAAYSGSVDRGRYILTLAGTGTFNLTGSISNSSGGGISVTGAGMRVNIRGTLNSASPSAMTLNIAADIVSVSIANGRVINGGASSAINVTSGRSGVEIDISGGEITSHPNGNAINDSGINTRITVRGGTVKAGGASAIRSTGKNSTVAVSGGTVTNEAGNNFNPAIDMDGDNIGGSANNVMVSGNAVVQSTSAQGYAIQSRGNVLVQGNAQVTAINGRAINLVGMNSTATINDNASVRATGSGTAISTATTDSLIAGVANAGVIVNGGTVSSATGNAINVTGANSKVTVNGGSVSATSGNAINVANTGVNAEVTIDGGQVTATSGRAIYVVSTAANATVRANSGFVFAYGNSRASVIYAANIVPANFAGSYVVVCTWDDTKGVTSYLQDSHPRLDLELWSIGTAGTTNYWYNHPTLGAGISYVYGSNVGFFPLPFLTVTRSYGLIFDSYTGRLYVDTANPSDAPGRGAIWEGSPGELRLNNFSWVTSVPAALTIINGPARIILDGNGKFESTLGTGDSWGIKSNDNLTVETDKGTDCYSEQRTRQHRARSWTGDIGDKWRDTNSPGQSGDKRSRRRSERRALPLGLRRY
jgi:hypothetical protein